MQLARILYVQAVLTVLALCVVWQTAYVRLEGYRLEALRREKERCETEVQSCRAHIERLKSPPRILHLVESLRLPLTQLTPEPSAAAVQDQTPREPVQVARRPATTRAD
jgi:C4-dicarboxylate-specific signal transduction histidine kinase